ncbi:MAG TPA: class II aldolase/adducin family protein [Streptosporangiaceae bacterium]|jgi:L-fuculose-phosphate aldolase
MTRPESAELCTAREQLAACGQLLVAAGLAVGASGNLSVATSDGIAITPSGIGYHELTPADMCVVAPDGTHLYAPEVPSTETPMHLAVYAATGAGAIVHSHSAEVIALSAVHDELPAIHYAITELGGPVRVAPYLRFGSEGLARAAVAGLDGRSAVILRNHGALAYGDTLAAAYDRALLLEWLALVWRLAVAHGTPRVLSAQQLAEVAAERERRHYGERRRPPGTARPAAPD